MGRTGAAPLACWQIESSPGDTVYSPLADGVLPGRYWRDADPAPGTRMGKLISMPQPAAHQWATRMLTDRNLTIADEVAAVAARLGAMPTAVALARAAAQQPAIPQGQSPIWCSSQSELCPTRESVVGMATSEAGLAVSRGCRVSANGP